MSRQELGGDVWYDGGLKGYAMLDVTDHIPALHTIMVDGVALAPKRGEFHVSIAKLRALAERNPAQEAAMALFIEHWMQDEEKRLIWGGFTDSMYVCQKPNAEGETQMTVIAGVEIIGLSAMERAMRHTFNPAIRLSQPHVTLLKSATSPYGIGINSPEDLATLCRRDDGLRQRIFA